MAAKDSDVVVGMPPNSIVTTGATEDGKEPSSERGAPQN